jgi:hypothetical protein
VKDGVAAGDGAINGGGIGEVAGKNLDAAGREGVLPSSRMGRAGEAADGVTAGLAELHDGLAEEAAAAGDEDFHGKEWEEDFTAERAERGGKKRREPHSAVQQNADFRRGRFLFLNRRKRR